MELSPDVVGDTLSDGRLPAIDAACSAEAGTRERDLNVLGLTDAGAVFRIE